MEKTSVHIRYKEEPLLLDKVLQNMQKKLKANLNWLDYAFGRAYKLTENESDGSKFIYPAVYNSNGEYVSVLPNDNFGNFSWFDIYDPQVITDTVQGMPIYTFTGALIFWYNLKTIYEDESVLYTEEIKNEILSVLTSPGVMSTLGKFTVTSLYERFENIYRGYTIEKVYNSNNYDKAAELDKQYFMYPYAGLRIEFTLTTRELCRRRVI